MRQTSYDGWNTMVERSSVARGLGDESSVARGREIVSNQAQASTRGSRADTTPKQSAPSAADMAMFPSATSESTVFPSTYREASSMAARVKSPVATSVSSLRTITFPPPGRRLGDLADLVLPTRQISSITNTSRTNSSVPTSPLYGSNMVSATPRTQRYVPELPPAAESDTRNRGNRSTTDMRSSPYVGLRSPSRAAKDPIRRVSAAEAPNLELTPQQPTSPTPVTTRMPARASEPIFHRFSHDFEPVAVVPQARRAIAGSYAAAHVPAPSSPSHAAATAAQSTQLITVHLELQPDVGLAPSPTPSTAHVATPVPPTNEGCCCSPTDEHIERIDAGKRYSEAVVHGGITYLSGQVAEATIGFGATEQTHEVLRLIDSLLSRAGTHKGRILTATVILANMADYPDMNREWDAWVMPGAAPCRVTFQGLLARPEWRVEISVTAAAGLSQPQGPRRLALTLPGY